MYESSCMVDDTSDTAVRFPAVRSTQPHSHIACTKTAQPANITCTHQPPPKQTKRGTIDLAIVLSIAANRADPNHILNPECRCLTLYIGSIVMLRCSRQGIAYDGERDSIHPISTVTIGFSCAPAPND